jgi:hypothetical protein
MGIVAGFGQVIPNFELVFLTAQLARNPCGKVIRKGQENLRAEGCVLSARLREIRLTG